MNFPLWESLIDDAVVAVEDFVDGDGDGVILTTDSSSTETCEYEELIFSASLKARKDTALAPDSTILKAALNAMSVLRGLLEREPWLVIQ